MKRKNIITISIIAVLLLVTIAILFTSLVKKVDIVDKNIDSETLRAMKYEELTDNDKKTQSNCVEFSAFFTRDINNDGYAERLKGTCKEIGKQDILYVELNVLTRGYLKNGRITLNTDNFTWRTAIVNDNIVDGDYIGETKTIKLKDKIQNGSQKLFSGMIQSKIGNNVNNYSKVNSIVLEGTYVDDDGNETPINKIVDLTVDWYGKTTTSILENYQSYDISDVVNKDNVLLTFNAEVSEQSNELLLQKQVLEVNIPKLNGYSASNIVVEGEVDYRYNEQQGLLTIERKSETDENGRIVKSIARKNKNTVKITYPEEAYTQMSVNSIILNIPIVGYNYGYNNQNEEFQNPYVSTDEKIITVTYSRPKGNIWNVYPDVGEPIYNFSDSNKINYKVSKEITNNIYNGNIYEDIINTYPVNWEVIISDYKSVKKITLEEIKRNNHNMSDEFLNNSGNFESMYDYITTTGVYFKNATRILEKDGWIKLYNGETGSLIETFTSATWEEYSKDNPYKLNVKSIKIETSEPKSNTTFVVSQIKEINDELLTKNYTKEEFDKLSYIYTYLKAEIEAPEGITFENGSSKSEINKSGHADYEMPYSISQIEVNPYQIANQKTQNVNLKIKTSSSSNFERKWIDGIFLIELPEDIINVNIKKVESANDKVEISAYESYEQNGKQYIKIYTKNEEEQLYNIFINADITPNPLKPTENQVIKLYSYNKNCDNYYENTKDIYDIDTDGNKDDNVGYERASLSLIAPSGLLTTEYITNYDDLNSRTIAPNIADIEKSNEKRTATVNVSLTNNYNGTISNAVILGKIPYAGNTYVLNGDSLNSQYTANIIGRINIPEELKQYVTIYYSNIENPTKDINSQENSWKIEEDIKDWSTVKTYLIDLGSYKLQKTENRVFSYEVEVPPGLGYNSVSYSTHAIYYDLDTESGKLSTQTEPNKVGIRVVSKYNMQVTKNKNNFDEMFVPGATYKISTHMDGNEVSKTETTKADGTLKFNGLYVEQEYTFKEIYTPENYCLSKDEIRFIANIDENGQLIFNVTNGKFKQTPEVTIDKNGNYLVKTKVEDESKYTLRINKTDENGNKLEGTRFLLKGKEKNNISYKTDKNGIITITGLYLDELYELKETKSEGYYVDENAREFKIIRNENGNLEIQTEDKALKDVEIIEQEGIVQATVIANIQNEKIPKYNLQVLKVEENLQENVQSLKPLSGASFRLISEDLDTQKEYITDSNGYINIFDLYEYVEGKYITGKYILQETKAPNGYSNNAEEIKFSVTRNLDGNLKVVIENEQELTSLKSVVIEGNLVKIIVQDKPLFRLTKVDSDTGMPLANAKFVIFELDTNGKELDYAKDVNGDYVGEKNEHNQYVVTTDENGIIILPLRGGIYKIVEIGFPEGYQEKDEGEIFKIEGCEEVFEEETEESKLIESENVINYIEDLVDLSKKVNSGDTYARKTVYLGRTLDFEDDNSYKNPDDKSYGDLNEDGTIEGIKAELTDKNDGIGFTSIGGIANDSRIYFSGIFNGQGYEIRNIYINNEFNASYTGVFGKVSNGKILNLGITGNITGFKNSNITTGGIAGYIKENSLIENCYNKSVIDGYISGGIVGQLNDSIVKNCYNTKSINANGPAGGIVGSANNGEILNCYNIGDVKGYYVGSIIGVGSSKKVEDCYYLDKIKLTGNTNPNGIIGIPKTSEYMKGKAFITDLNEEKWFVAWTEDKNNINNGYPIFNKILNINSIEDLVEFSKEVNSGNTFKNIKINLSKTLDFNEDNSYKNSLDKSYGDLNGDGVVEGIKQELTDKEDGNGFTPIGIENAIFSGVFDGQGNEIRNLFINRSQNAGLFGVVSNGQIKNLGVSGNIISNTNVKYEHVVGGIASVAKNYSVINNCYNLCNINSNANIITFHNSSIVGGIVGKLQDSKISNSYNSGEIVGWYNEGANNIGGIVGYIINEYRNNPSTINNVYNTATINGSVQLGTNRLGGIVGYSSDKVNIENVYNLGDVIANINDEVENHNRGYYSHAGGIIGQCNSSSDISNSYNTGNVIGTKINNIYVGGIIGNKDDMSHGKINNCYYLDTIEIEGGTIISNGTAVSNEYMKSKEFYNILNTDDVWCYRNNNYPKLNTGIPIYITEGTNITIENTIKNFKITTEVGENIEKQRTGGTITGLYNDKYLEVNFRKFVETVKYGNNSTQEIAITPEENYYISKITINGLEKQFTPDANGNVILPIGYFENMTEDKHIVVTFVIKNNSLVIEKQDEDGKKLSGAKFEITTTDGNSIGTVTTNESGIAIMPLENGQYVIKEIQAPQHHILLTEPINVDLTTNDVNRTITVTNKKKANIIVHHYLKDGDKYTTTSVADDEILEGKPGDYYTTSPKIDIQNYVLEKDTDGEYVIPDNASGIYTQEQQVIIYYYEAKPVNLIVHHYLEGTETKLEEDVVENHNKGYNYQTHVSEKLLEDYEFVSVNGKENGILEEDTVITYYYKLKTHVITTQIQEHTENRTDKLTNEKTEIVVLGGKITGEYTEEYSQENKIQYVETVKQKLDSKITIIANPDINYRVKKIKLVSTNDSGNKTESIIYGEGKDENSEVKYTEDAEGSISLTTFNEVTENKHIIVEFEPVLGTVMVHHYLQGTGEEFGTEPVKVLSKDGNIIENETKQDYIEEDYVTKANENVAVMYKLVSTSGELNGKYIDGIIHVYYYYDYNNYEYKIEHYYENKESGKYEKDEAQTVSKIAKYQDIIQVTEKDRVLKTGYKYEYQEGSPLKITEVLDNNVIKLYYGLDNYEYTVEYYYDGIKDDTLTEKKNAKYQDKITTYTDKLKKGYALEKTENLPLIITEKTEDNIIKIYYKTQYKITTDVIEHTENYKNGEVKQNIKGGEITGEDLEPYEKVFKGEQPKNIIKMTPTMTENEEYEIVKVVIKENKEDEEGKIIDLEKLDIQEDGSIVLPVQYLADEKEGMQSSKHIEVEYRKKTKVIVKYLEEKSENVLAQEETMFGYEGENFTTNRKVIVNYMTSELNITDENKIEIQKDGVMYADTITIIYWYKKVPSGIIVRHVEKVINKTTNVETGEEKITVTGIILDEEQLPGYAGDIKETTRKEFENYISAENNEATEGINVGKDENSKIVTMMQDEIVEVVYWYEKEFKITTHVIEHEEIDKQGNVIKVKGGKISGENETPYEKVIRSNDSTKEIKITPDNGYKIKKVLINGKEIDVTNNIKEDGSLILDKFINMQEDKKIEVEFEKMPAKVIVQYKDIDTKEEIIETKKINGFVNDAYNEPRVEIDGYIKSNPEPENSNGIMTKEDIIIVYWYTKQYKIITDVKEHEEIDEQGNVIKVKGGEISGEDENPYELVSRGENSVKEIVMKPEDGYMIKNVTINGEVLEIKELLKEDKTIKLPFFEDVREDKEVIVEYEKIPAKVIIQYLEEGTQKPVSKEEIKEGYVNNKYESKEREIEYYEFVKEKYPENSEGLMTEDDIIVKYYYRKALFNFKLEKEIESIILNGQSIDVTNKNKAKLEIKYKNINETELEIGYKIKVTNTEKVEGTAIIEENIPGGFEFIQKKSSTKWKEKDGKYILQTGTIEPEKTVEYKVTLRWKPEEANEGEKINIAKITNTTNIPNYEETTKKDNEDTAIIEIKLEKTIKDIINNIKEESVNMPKTGQTRIIYISAVIIAGSCVGIIIWRKKKGKKKI